MTEAKNITESNERLKELDVTLQKIGKTLSALHNGISEISKATEFVGDISSSLENIATSLIKVDNQMISLSNTTTLACKELKNFTDIISDLNETIDELNPKLGDMSSQIKGFEEESAKSAASNSFGDNLKQQKSTLNEWCQSVADSTSGIKSLMETVNESFTFGENISKVGSSVVKKVGEIRGSFKQLQEGLKAGDMKKYYSALEKLPLTSLARAAKMKAQTIKVKVSPVLEKAVNSTADFGKKFLVKPVKSAVGGVKKFASSPKDYLPSMGNISNSAKSLGKNVFVNPAKSVIEGIKKYASSLKDAANAAKNSSGWIGKLSSSFSKINIASRLSALGLGIKTVAVNGLKWATGTALPFLGGLIAQTWAWTAALLANPVVLIVTGILALIAAVVVCWNKFAEFRAVIMTAWEVVAGFGSAIWDFLVTPFKVAGEIINGIMQGIGIVLSGGSFLDGVKAVGDGIKKGLDAGVQSLTDAGSKAKDAVSNIDGKYDVNLKKEQEKDKAKKSGKETEAESGLPVTPTSPKLSEVQPQMVPRESTAMQMTFSPNVTISSELTEKSKSDLMDILQQNASYLASIINEQNRKEKRLNYGVS